MSEKHEKHAAKTGEDYSERHVRLDELRRLVAVGLANQKQHSGGYGSVELDEAIHIDNSQQVGHNIHRALEPKADLARHNPQHKAQQAHIDKYLFGGKRVGMIAALGGHYGIDGHQAQHEHEHDERAVTAQRLEHGRQHAPYLVSKIHPDDCKIFGKITSFYFIYNK